MSTFTHAKRVADESIRRGGALFRTPRYVFRECDCINQTAVMAEDPSGMWREAEDLPEACARFDALWARTRFPAGDREHSECRAWFLLGAGLDAGPVVVFEPDADSGVEQHE